MRHKFFLTLFSSLILVAANAQNVGIGTKAPFARLHVTDSSVLFSAAGNIPATPHNTPISGAGRRMMWYPDKAAFRAGAVIDAYTNESTYWDAGNIGDYSFASGLDAEANGYGSISMGGFTHSSGPYSTAMGSLTTASGGNSTAIGFATTASGDNSTAIGNEATANSGNSLAMGSYTTASGNFSTAMGYNTTARSDSSTAMGIRTVANGISSTAMGHNTIAAGYVSTTMGQSTIASGSYSTAMGLSTIAAGSSSTAMGVQTTASGDNSTAMGEQTTAKGDNSTAMGSFTTANGGNSTAIGSLTTASGDFSTAMGYEVSTGGEVGSFVIGDADPANAGLTYVSVRNQFVSRFYNGYYLLTSSNSNPRTGVLMNHGDNSWSAISDSTKKEKMLPIDEEDLLNKIARFKLSTWNYKGQDPKTFRHYGPMAQDFHNAFGKDALGTIGCDTLINQQDFLGISFIAIQALEKRTQKIEKQQKQISDLKKQNTTLQQQVDNQQQDNIAMKEQMRMLLSTVASLNKQVEAFAAKVNNQNTISVNK